MSRIRRINVPDYDTTKVINVKSKLNAENEWTAPSNGYVILFPLEGSDNGAALFINNIYITYVRYSNQFGDTNHSGPIPVAKDDVLKISKPSDLEKVEFYPAK